MAEQSVVTRVKTFITMCDHNSRFEPVKANTNGWTLEKARARLAAIADEIKEIESAPKPSDDIKARLEIFVRMLQQAGRPIFHKGLGAAGADLMLMWPVHPQANWRDLNGYEQLDANPLLFEAWMRPAELLARLLQEVHDISQRPLPPSKRGARIRELQAEALDLRFIEEQCLCDALDKGKLPVRQVDAPPEAVLMHRVHAPQREAKEARSQAVA